MFRLLFDGWVSALFQTRRDLLELVGPDSFWGFLAWWFWLLLTLVFATCCGYFISVASDGSGIPRMRALFAGVHQNPADVLSFKTFIGRSIGTILVSGSGLSVGRSGPFAHIMSIIAYQLSKFPLFRRVYFGPENFLYLRAGMSGLLGLSSALGSELMGDCRCSGGVRNHCEFRLSARRRALQH